jgi:glucose-6-phosphate 1-epimerase
VGGPELSRLAIPEALRFEDAGNGLTRALVATPQTEAEIYLHGAHVTRWIPRGQRPVLFTSSRSFFAPGKPIRGGVPVIFPWFGPRAPAQMRDQAGPMHGFARTMEWTVETTRLRTDGAVELHLTLPPDDSTRELGYADFYLTLHLAIGSHLEMELEVRNTSGQDLPFEEALHSYFAVGDIHQVSLFGLEGTTYLDKTDAFRSKQQPASPIRIAKETDQVHVNTVRTCVIEAPAWSRRIVIEKSGSATTVVWNPWIDKTRSLADMAPQDWRDMLCVETANAGENAIRLAPAATHRMRATLRVE